VRLSASGWSSLLTITGAIGGVVTVDVHVDVDVHVPVQMVVVGAVEGMPVEAIPP
jgi:hypothetical protein